MCVDLGTTTKSNAANITGASASADSAPSQGVPEDKNKSTNKQLYVWLVSDTIIRDEKLRPAPTAEGLRAELSKRLGVDLKVRESTKKPSDEGKCGNCIVEGDCLDCIVRTRRLETWQVQWERPRPSLVALAAGSCLVVTYEGQEIDPQILRRVEMEGIGERRAEGFGQVRFNHPLVCKRPAEWAEVVSAKKSAEQSSAGSETDREGAGNVPPARLDGDLAVFARMLECEYIKKEIRRASVRIASQRDRRKELLGWQLAGPQGAPPMSQLGGLRSQIIQVRGWDDGKRVLDWLEHLEQNPRRKEKWPEQSIDKVRSLFRERSKIWEVLEIPYWPDLTPNARTQLQSELWAFAIRSLLDACIRAHKRDLEGVPS
ncbi:MAG: hypothetical protein KatS3mg110_0504 [Pirellulaceae bacterium]|nr:MAG: hypothetical protein KatS3mg110_0504 [Pirellulaceae bacterium]